MSPVSLVPDSPFFPRIVIELMKDYSKIIEETILPLVRKPGRYIGEFVTGCSGLPSAGELKVLLAFPDTCEVGVANLGIRILGSVLKKTNGVLVDYCFAPWPDFEEELRRTRTPLVSLCHSIPVTDFDVVGFSLQYELQSANVLTMLDLGGVPLFSSERTDDHPLVIAGGSCALNPEPLSDFIDCFSIGDGEETIGQVCSVVRALKANGKSRRAILEELSGRPGLYVPSCFPIERGREGTNVRDVSVRGRVRSAVAKSIEQHAPLTFTPRIEVTHDRLNVEVMRGCTHGCRFCMAGYVYRPVREKEVDLVLEEARREFSKTGAEEISLISLSTPDYSGLPELLPLLENTFVDKGVEVTLPSMRPDTLTPRLVEELGRFKKSGMTLAPEAGTRRLRDVINKGMDDEDVVRAISAASESGWNLIKLYFMIGLPTETEEDLRAIPRLVEKAIRESRRLNPKANLNVSISPFIPKAHTPFQWERQDSLEEMAAKIRQVVEPLRRLPIKVKWRDPGVSFVEGVIARGDRRVGDVILRAWKKGAKLDGWSDFFRLNFWCEALDEAGLEAAQYTRARSVDEPLAWDHIEVVNRDFLLAERKAAQEGRLTADCRAGVCHGCGILDETGLTPEEACFAFSRENDSSREGDEASRPAELEAGAQTLTGGKYRFQYEKKGRTRFLSHLDMVRILTRALRAACLPVSYSAGYRSRPRVSFGPPLPLGFTSTCEYFDVELETAPQEDPLKALNTFLPEGIRLVEWKRLAPGTASLSSVCTLARYEVEFPGHLLELAGLSDRDLASLLGRAGEILAKKESVVLEKGPHARPRSITLANAIRGIVPSAGAGQRVQMLLSIQGKDVIRPDEVIEILAEDRKIERRYLRVERTALCYETSKGMRTPM